MDVQRLISACIFVASKVEEVSHYFGHFLLNTMWLRTYCFGKPLYAMAHVVITIPDCQLPILQSPVRTNDLLNAVRFVTSPQDSTALAGAFPGLSVSDTSASGTGSEPHQPAGDANGSASNAPRAGFLAGDDYYAAKDQLIMDEQLLLRVLRFEIAVQHAHKYLLNMCHVLRCSQPLAQMATCLVRREMISFLCHPCTLLTDLTKAIV